MTYTRIPHTTFDEWLDQRREYVTATEAARLLESPSYHRTLRDEKTNGSSFTGNRYTEWGKKREPEIAEYLSVFGPDTRLEPNNDLLVLTDTRYAATPDMISADGEVIGEIKTTGEDFSGHIPGRYFSQVQWQLFVTGAEACVFAWEIRLVNDDGSFTPGDIKTTIIRPDVEHQWRLQAVADQFLADDVAPLEVPENLESLVVEKLELEQQLAGVVDAIKRAVGTEPALYDLPTATVTVTADGKSERLDTKALAADHPDLVAHYYVTSARKGSVRVKQKKEVV